jgi:hypothetical protein
MRPAPRFEPHLLQSFCSEIGHARPSCGAGLLGQVSTLGSRL